MLTTTVSNQERPDSGVKTSKQKQRTEFAVAALGGRVSLLRPTQSQGYQ